MKIKGIVTLVFRDKDTGEITRELTQENNITNYWIEGFMITHSPASPHRGKFGPNIFVSGYDIPATDPTVRFIPDIHAFGFVDSGVTSPTFTESTATDFAFGQFQQRFSPPAALININIIGLTWDATLNADGTADAQAYVKLASTCTQSPSETLDVFYRIQYPYDYFLEPSPLDRNTNQISGKQTDIMGERLTLTYMLADYFNKVMGAYNGNLDFTRLRRISASKIGSPDSATPLQTGVKSQTSDASIHKLKLDSTLDISKTLGHIQGFLTYGSAGSASTNFSPWARAISDIGDNVVQNIFGHGPTADKPFFDATKLNSGDGTIVVNGDAWTNPDFPKQYKLNVTTSGALGVGEYNFQVRNHFGFKDNTYQNHTRVLHALTLENKHMHGDLEFNSFVFSGDAAEVRRRPTIIKYDIDSTIKNLLAVTKTEVYAFELQTETGTMFNAITFPAFTATNITQVTYEPGGDIFVGCRDTGIYKISDPLGSPTVTLIDNTTTGLTGLTSSECYGVVVGNARLWAVFEGGLFSSADSGATWVAATFTDPTITSDWSLVKYIKADPTHADQRLALVFESSTPGTGTFLVQSIMWWDETSTNAILGLQFMSYNRTTSNTQYTGQFAEEPWSYFNTLVPSPTQNKWGVNMKSSARTSTMNNGYVAYLTFGTTSFTQTVATVNQSYATFIDWELDSGGDQNIAFISTVNFSNSASLDIGFGLYKDDTTTQRVIAYDSNTGTYGHPYSLAAGPICYIGGMVYIGWEPIAGNQVYVIGSLAPFDDLTGGPFEHILWETYGWDGANWVLDNPNSKPFHASAEVLNDGLTVAFDDNAGAQTFIVNDYYTVGVLQGIWMDGATQLEHSTGLYFKKITGGQIATEVGVLSGSVRSPEIFERTPNEMTWQDQFSVTTSTPEVVRTNPAVSSYEAGARSIEKIAGTGITDKSANDQLHGRMIFGLYTNMSNVTQNITCGLSPASVIGTAINRNTVAFGWELIPKGPGFDNGVIVDASIIENGVVVAPNVLTFDAISSASYDFEVEILNNGTVNYYMMSTDDPNQPLETYLKNTRQLWYTSATSAPIVDYHIDLAMNGSSVGIDTRFNGSGSTIHPGVGSVPAITRRLTTRVVDDLYMTIGSFGSSLGRYTNNFFAIDYSQNIEILIDGTPVTLVLENDTSTVLAAGEVSVFAREGFLRYSGADAGKTISMTYNVLTTE